MPDGSYIPSVGLNPQVTPFNTNTNRFDPGMGRAAQQARQELFPLVRLANGLMLTQSIRESEARATEVANNASKQIGELMQNYQSLSNKDAVDNIGLFEKKLHQLNDAYLKEIDSRGDPLASRLVKQHMNKLMLSNDLQARAHWLDQTKSYQLSELKNAEAIAQDEYNKAYGTAAAPEKLAELNAASDQLTRAQGFEPDSETGYMARLKAEDEVHKQQIQWLIDEERFGEAAAAIKRMNPAKNKDSRMLMSTWQDLHAKLRASQNAAAAQNAGKFNPWQFYEQQYNHYLELAQKSEDLQYRVVTEYADPEAAANAQIINGVMVDAQGKPLAVKLSRVRLTQAEIEQQARNFAAQETLMASQAIIDHNNYKLVLRRSAQTQLNAALQASGGREITMQNSPEVARAYSMAAGGNLDEAAKMLAADQGRGIKSAAAENAFARYYTGTRDTYLRTFPTTDSMIAVMHDAGATPAQIEEFTAKDLALRDKERGAVIDQAHTLVRRSAVKIPDLGIDDDDFQGTGEGRAKAEAFISYVIENGGFDMNLLAQAHEL